MATWEGLAPRRGLSASLRVRWLGNFSLAILDTILIRTLFPVLGVGLAVLAAEQGWGLFHRIDAPAPVAFAVTFLALDLVRYAGHSLLHRVPLLWCAHRMHHTDQDYDFTTGLRFHPFESLFTTALDLAVIAALGAPALAVALFEIGFVVVALCVHGNVGLPAGLDGVLRRVFVTPDMHRVHHSAVPRETDSNFGSILSVWDRLFRTYVAQPSGGHRGMTVGLLDYRDRRHLTIPGMLAAPFLSGDRQD